jgi:cytochrome c biogenesis protein CcdA
MRSLRAGSLLKLGIGTAIVLALLLIGYRLGSGVSLGGQGGTVSVSDAEVCLRRGSTIYFTAILGTEDYIRKLGAWEDVAPRLRMAQPFVLNAATHVGTLRQLSLDDKIFLVADGVRYPSLGQVLGLTAHHNTYLVFFPRHDMQGKPLFERASGAFDLVIELGADVDSILPQRVLTFRHPLPVAGAVRSDFTRVLVLFGATLAALLLTCTPCLVGSLMVGSFTMGTAAGVTQRDALQQARAAMIRKTLYYLAALVIAYLTVAMVISIYKLQAESLRPVELLGGALLLLMGLNFLRSWSLVPRVEKFLINLVVRKPELRITNYEFGSESSSAMGASLAMVCSVAGAPTLSTAIILPVMVYAGLTDLSWSFFVLLIYLLVSAVPFFFIAVGLGEFLLTASLRFRHALMIANGLLLIGLGLLLILSPQAVADTLSAPARILLKPFTWLF